MPHVDKLRAKDPKKIGPYKILGRLGSGGMGVVFLGSLGGKQVAVKTVRNTFLDDPGLRSRFNREIDNLKKMKSPRIAKYLDSAIDDEIAWHAVEYVDGPNLRELVKSQGPLSQDQWWRLASELVESLQYLDRLGIVHRDIKPSNIIMSDNGMSLIDFGISQDTDSTSITTTGMVAGSPAWLAPEQLEGSSISSASDWFSAGSVLVFAARGKSPWGNETSMTIPVLHQKILSAAPDFTGLTQEQKALLESLLNPNPKGRKLPKVLAGELGPQQSRSASSVGASKTSGESSQTRVNSSFAGLNVFSPGFSFGLVITFLVGGLLGASQVVPFLPWQTDESSNSIGLATREFNSGEPCGDLETAAVDMIKALEDASADVGTVRWDSVQPSVDKAISDYETSLLAIPAGDLPVAFVNENRNHLRTLASRLDTVQADSQSTMVTALSDYIFWRSHVGSVFEAGQWCG